MQDHVLRPNKGLSKENPLPLSSGCSIVAARIPIIDLNHPHFDPHELAVSAMD